MRLMNDMYLHLFKFGGVDVCMFILRRDIIERIVKPVGRQRLQGVSTCVEM